MRIKFHEYNQGYRIVSLAKNEEVKDEQMEKGLSVLYVRDTEIILYPENIILSVKLEEIESLNQFNNYDVLDIMEDGLLTRRYDDCSEDNYFFITGACNSNCIMCPSPEGARKNVGETNFQDLLELAKHIPQDAPHLTITGGEPFLVGENIFPFMNYLKEKFLSTEFLILTNGRIFSIEKYLYLFLENIPQSVIVAIPIHASNSDLHDSITRSPGSFEQTKRGIKQLLKYSIPVEIRLVVNKLNIDDFDNIANLIIHHFKGIEHVSIIAMEMTGNARTYKEKVWIPYRESISKISNAIRKLVQNGVNVKLYNFPICTVEKSFWTLCERSISPNKVRFAETCESCKYKTACGGVFAGTFSLEKDELRAIL